jgi:hypothetical protein
VVEWYHHSRPEVMDWILSARFPGTIKAASWLAASTPTDSDSDSYSDSYTYTYTYTLRTPSTFILPSLVHVAAVHLLPTVITLTTRNIQTCPSIKLLMDRGPRVELDWRAFPSKRSRTPYPYPYPYPYPHPYSLSTLDQSFHSYANLPLTAQDAHHHKPSLARTRSFKMSFS